MNKMHKVYIMLTTTKEKKAMKRSEGLQKKMTTVKTLDTVDKTREG